MFLLSGANMYGKKTIKYYTLKMGETLIMWRPVLVKV